MINFIEIELGGQLRRFKFDMFAVEFFEKEIAGRILANPSIAENPKLAERVSINCTIYAGLSSDYTLKSKQIDFTYEDIVDWVDKADEEGKYENVKKICDTYANTFEYKKWLKEFQDRIQTILEPDENKKKGKKVK